MLETFDVIEEDAWFTVTNPAVNNNNCKCGDQVRFISIFNGDRTAGAFYVDRTKVTVILTYNDVSLIDEEDADKWDEEVDTDDWHETDTTETRDTCYLIVKQICNTIVILAIVLCVAYCTLQGH